MRLTIRPLAEPRRELDLTHRLVAVIAEELWKRYGGNDTLNWLEAERHLQRLLAGRGARADPAPFIGVLDVAKARARGGVRKAPRPGFARGVRCGEPRKSTPCSRGSVKQRT